MWLPRSIVPSPTPAYSAVTLDGRERQQVFELHLVGDHRLEVCGAVGRAAEGVGVDRHQQPVIPGVGAVVAHHPGQGPAAAFGVESPRFVGAGGTGLDPVGAVVASCRTARRGSRPPGRQVAAVHQVAAAVVVVLAVADLFGKGLTVGSLSSQSVLSATVPEPARQLRDACPVAKAVTVGVVKPGARSTGRVRVVVVDPAIAVIVDGVAFSGAVDGGGVVAVAGVGQYPLGTVQASMTTAASPKRRCRRRRRTC